MYFHFMKNLIFLILILLVGIVLYMYFFGKGEDKEKAGEIVNETKELGRSVGEFIKRQKEKYDAGEFDRLVDKINRAIDKLKSKKEPVTAEESKELKVLEDELRQIDTDKLTPEERERLQKLLDDLEAELQKE